MCTNETRVPHQPRHALAAASHAERSQLGMDARRAVGASAVCIDRLDLLLQRGVGSRPGRRWPVMPGIEAAGGHTQHATECRYWMRGLLSPYELEGRPGFEWVSCAKKAAATL